MVLCKREAMMTVLIVDDHPSFRVQARRLLEEGGFEVIGEAQDGATALEAAAALEPQAILLDIQLPDATGFDVCRSLTAAAKASAVVLVSSRGASDYGNKIFGCGARGFISKADLTARRFAALVEAEA
jgi:DNA-binding NarL/FixJ family response regulator